MNLLLVFVLLTVGFTALLMGVSIVAHGFLYQSPAPRLPLRALIAGVLLGGFLTLWALVDKKWPNKDGTVQYDTFFNFSAYTTSEFTEFEAVRWPATGDKLKTDASGNPVEVVVKFKRSAGGKGATFVEEGTNKGFLTHTGEYMTGAIRVKGPTDPEPVRYNAMLKENPRTKMKEYAAQDDGRRFVEDKGSRYVTMSQPGTLFVPSTGTIAFSLFLNFSLLLVWLLATWPVLRYTFLHAAGLTAVGTLITMLTLMPLLFKFNRPDAKPAPAPAVAWVEPARDRLI